MECSIKDVKFHQRKSDLRVSHWTLSADAGLAVSASYDGLLKVWDAENGIEKHRLRDHAIGIPGIAMSEGGHLAVYNSENRTMRVWIPPDEAEDINTDIGTLNRTRVIIPPRQRGKRLFTFRESL
jgi:WD40 repeat protein